MTVAEPYPDLVSLVVGRDVIPYNDLEIAPAYGRKILLPDDLPPVLSLGYSLGPTVPRAFRCQEDGALNVHVENQSGGGGPIVADPQNTDGYWRWDNTGIIGNPQILAADQLILYRMQWSIQIYSDSSFGSGRDTIEIGIGKASNTHPVLQLANVEVSTTHATDYTYPGEMHGSCDFPFGLDLPATIGDGGPFAFYLFASKLTGSASVSYVAGPRR